MLPWMGLLAVLGCYGALAALLLCLATKVPRLGRITERLMTVSPGPCEAWFALMRTDPYGLSRAAILFALPRMLSARPCAVCRGELAAPVAVCKACETAAHEACWRFARGCPRYGCEPRAGEPVGKLG